ncbi:hypothetical protein BGZ68_009310 [Mortierella alpina]|nr:hypothetical protein BGZ68_009310 [Mortierella alpina]
MAEKDLELLDNVELRFALAESDSQLEKTLSTFLCPVLLKLASPAENVRAKVIAILTHINKRIRPKPSIKLPLHPLLLQFSHNSSVLVKNFTLIYIEMGYERIPVEDKVELLPQLIRGLACRPLAQQTTLVHMILPALSQIKQFNEDNTTADPYGFEATPSDAICLLLRLQDVLLYRQPTIGSQGSTLHQVADAAPSSPRDGTPETTTTSASPLIPEGMSPMSVQQVTNNGKATWATSSELKNIKTGALRFICSTTAFPDALPTFVHLERFVALIGATGDAYSEAVNMGEDGLKRLKLPDLEDKKVVDRLYQMYQGSNRGQAVPGQEEVFRQPSSNAVKLKLMGYLTKSKTASESFPAALQVSFDCLYGPKTNNKLLMAGMAFIQWIARMIQQLQKDLLMSLKDMTIVEDFFGHLTTETPNVKTYIQEALCTMLDAYNPMQDWATAADIARILSIIENNISKEEHQARFCAVKYATSLFPFSDVTSKYICLMTVADSKLEIREEAKLGLTFPKAGDLSENAKIAKTSLLPDFIKLIEKIHEKSTGSQRHNEEARTRPTFGKSFIMGYSSEVFIHILQFIRRLLITSADPDVIIEESSNEYELQQFVFTPSTRDRVKAWLKDMWATENRIDSEQKSLSTYISFLEVAMNHRGLSAPSSLSQQYSHRLGWFKTYIGSTSAESRHAVAHILGIVGTDNLGSSNAQREVFLQFLLELFSAVKDKTKQTTTEQHHGSLLAMGYILGRILYRYSSQTFEIVPEPEFQTMVAEIVSDLDSKQNMWVSAASISLGEIGRYGVIPSKDASKDVKKLIEIANSTKDVKVQEHAIAALGHIGVGNANQVQDILSFFYEFGPKQTKQTEVNFTIGEAIACIGAGWRCSAMDVYADIADQDPNMAEIEHSVMDGILNTVLDIMAPSPKSATKKAACIWLLSLVKFCSSHASVKLQLPRLHAVFSGLLSDRDELTQEVASKGIGLVYELGDQSIRDQLVGSLVGMFGEGKKPVSKVTGDTELFDGNVLGQTPDGSSLSTYQSILSLASDMNQPELVYKFMHLASHNSMWQSRKGAAFGFSSIVSQAESELKPYLATLIPRLYRYQYDPNPKVNEAMTSIWRSLVKDPKKAVQEYFDVIINDLLESMGARQWRTRESSCLAMADLLQGRSVEEIEKYLEKIWTMSFRTLDDIKESVRTAAFKTCRALTLMTVRYCDPKHVSEAEGKRVLDIIVPFLVGKGLLSTAEEVSKFSLTTILKICKQADYLSFHTEKYQLTNEQLESSRLNAAKLSPMMEGIEACVENIDDSVMPELSSQLIATIRKAVGLPTKDIAGIWKDVWEEHTTGSASAVKLYADEIVRLLSIQITSASWNAKRQSATALKAVAIMMDLNKYAGDLLTLVVDGLSGRTWQGKEQVVELLPALALSSKEFLDDKPFRQQELAKVLIRESKKVNKQYRRYAIDALGKYLDAFPQLEYFPEVKSVLFDVLEDKGEMDVDEDEHEKPLQLMVMASAARAAGMAWTSNAQMQEQYSSEFVAVLSRALIHNIWNVRSAILESFDKFFAKLNVENKDAVVSEETLVLILDSLLEGSLKDYKYVGLRNQGLDVLQSFIGKIYETMMAY